MGGFGCKICFKDLLNSFQCRSSPDNNTDVCRGKRTLIHVVWGENAFVDKTFQMCCININWITDQSQKQNKTGSKLIKLSAPLIIHERNTDHANLTNKHPDSPQTQHGGDSARLMITEEVALCCLIDDKRSNQRPICTC